RRSAWPRADRWVGTSGGSALGREGTRAGAALCAGSAPAAATRPAHPDLPRARTPGRPTATMVEAPPRARPTEYGRRAAPRVGRPPRPLEGRARAWPAPRSASMPRRRHQPRWGEKEIRALVAIAAPLLGGTSARELRDGSTDIPARG